MQPYNHLILPEYDAELRRSDLAALEAVASPQPQSKNVLDANESPQPTFDRTLLGVMGILDEIAWQDNVSGWLRNGGLWAGLQPDSSPAEELEKFGTTESEADGDSSTTNPTTVNDAATKVKMLEIEDPLSLDKRRSSIVRFDGSDDDHNELPTKEDSELSREPISLSHSAKRKRPKKVHILYHDEVFLVVF